MPAGTISNNHPDNVLHFHPMSYGHPTISLKLHTSYGTHLLDHLAADGAGFAGGQVAVVALLQVDAHLPWCLFYIVNFQISIASSEVSAHTGKVGTGAWSERLPMNL